MFGLAEFRISRYLLQSLEWCLLIAIAWTAEKGLNSWEGPKQLRRAYATQILRRLDTISSFNTMLEAGDSNFLPLATFLGNNSSLISYFLLLIIPIAQRLLTRPSLSAKGDNTFCRIINFNFNISIYTKTTITMKTTIKQYQGKNDFRYHWPFFRYHLCNTFTEY